MLLAKQFGVFRAQFGVVAAAAFTDVMKQTCNVKKLTLRDALYAAMSNGKGLQGVFIAKAAHVANHHHGMRVDGVNMKQVMLHLSDDVTEGR